MATLPGVVAAGGINHFPLESAFYPDGTFLIAHANERLDSMDELAKLWHDPERTGSAEFRVASAGYFTVMDIPLVRGRMFDDRDTIDAPHVALISEALVRSRFAGVDPVGLRIQFGNMDGDLRLFTIVGVVSDLHEQGLESKPRPTFYANARQRPISTGDFTIVVRTNGSPESIASAARVAIQRIDPTVAPRLRTIDRVVASSVADRRFSALIVGAFAASAFLLAIAGLYGVLSYAVSQRTNEFGSRLGRGAPRRQVSALVLKQAGTIVAIGSAIGIGLAVAAASLVRSMLFGLGPTDPLTFAAVTATLAITALAACLWPALRATRVNPLTALRAD
jgi:predicted permease